MPPTLDEIRALKAPLKDCMIGLLGLEVLAVETDRTVLRLPYHARLASGFHGAALHHGALVGLATTAAFLHALCVTRPDATTVDHWLDGPQPWVREATATFLAPATGDVIAESVAVWDRDVDDGLTITTTLLDDGQGGVLVARVVTTHRVPRGAPIPVDVPTTLRY